MKLFNILLFCVALNQIQAQDWANLTRYSLENKTLLTSEQTIEAVFFGNSITEGWPQFSPTFLRSTILLEEGSADKQHHSYYYGFARMFWAFGQRK